MSDQPDLVFYRYDEPEPEPDPWAEVRKWSRWQVCTIDGRPGWYAFPVTDEAP